MPLIFTDTLSPSLFKPDYSTVENFLLKLQPKRPTSLSLKRFISQTPLASSDDDYRKVNQRKTCVFKSQLKHR